MTKQLPTRPARPALFLVEEEGAAAAPYLPCRAQLCNANKLLARLVLEDPAAAAELFEPSELAVWHAALGKLNTDNSDTTA